MDGLRTLALDLTPTSSDRPAEPTPSHFLVPLLHVMGERAKYRPRVVIPVERGKVRCSLKDEVLRVAGYNPDDPASMPFDLFQVDNPSGMYRRIYYAWHNDSAEFLMQRPKQSLPLFTSKDGGWALTEAGVAAAVLARSAFPDAKGTATGIWLEGFLANGGYEKLLRALEIHPSMVKERHSGEIEDHFHTYLVSVMHSRSFDVWLARGDTPTPKQIVEWALRRSISTFRKYSHDGLGRHMRGARTSQERAQAKVSVAAMAASTYSLVTQVVDEEVFANSEKVLVDSAASEEALNQFAAQEGLNRLRETLRRQKPGAADRYVRVLDLMLEGSSMEDIGEAENVSRNRAASLTQDTRNAIRRARDETLEARNILSYLREEPFATEEDISSDVAGVTDLSRMLKSLLSKGRITQKRGCYRITNSGAFLLDSWESLHGMDLGSLLSY